MFNNLTLRLFEKKNDYLQWFTIVFQNIRLVVATKGFVRYFRVVSASVDNPVKYLFFNVK